MPNLMKSSNPDGSWRKGPGCGAPICPNFQAPGSRHSEQFVVGKHTRRWHLLPSLPLTWPFAKHGFLCDCPSVCLSASVSLRLSLRLSVLCMYLCLPPVPSIVVSLAVPSPDWLVCVHLPPSPLPCLKHPSLHLSASVLHVPRPLSLGFVSSLCPPPHLGDPTALSPGSSSVACQVPEPGSLSREGLGPQPRGGQVPPQLLRPQMALAIEAAASAQLTPDKGSEDGLETNPLVPRAPPAPRGPMSRASSGAFLPQ